MFSSFLLFHSLRLRCIEREKNKKKKKELFQISLISSSFHSSSRLLMRWSINVQIHILHIYMQHSTHSNETLLDFIHGSMIYQIRLDFLSSLYCFSPLAGKELQRLWRSLVIQKLLLCLCATSNGHFFLIKWYRSVSSKTRLLCYVTWPIATLEFISSNRKEN